MEKLLHSAKLNNTSVNFTGSVYGGEPDYSWYWDFGDGNTSTEQDPTHTYTAVGKYDVTLTVTDAEDKDATDETYALIIMPPSNNPPDKPVIDGPTSGKPGIEYEYCILATDPDRDSLYIQWDWGDNEITPWLGPYESGQKICESYSWENQGTVIITVKLKDEHGEMVTASLIVTISKNKVTQNSIFVWLFERFKNSFPILQYIFR